jgi:Kef-type K+ transport system membrane component KefB
MRVYSRLEVANDSSRQPAQASEWVVGAGYITAILVIPALAIAAYLKARRSEHAPWVFGLALFFLAFWIVEAILRAD